MTRPVGREIAASRAGQGQREINRAAERLCSHPLDSSIVCYRPRHTVPSQRSNALEDFRSQLEQWQLFYSTVSLAAVTLAGLLFVSLSLRAEKLKDPKNVRYLRLAQSSFGDFLYVLMLGLVFLVPHQVPMGLAVALFVLGGARAVGLARQFRRVRNDQGESEGKPNAVREVALPAVASLGLIVVGAAILVGQMVAVYGLVLVVAAMLATASWNAWLILVGRPLDHV